MRAFAAIRRRIQFGRGAVAAAAAMAVATALIAVPAAAQDDDIVEAGTLLYGTGDYQVVRNLKEVPADSGAVLAIDDTLRVPIGAKLKAVMIDDSVLMLWEDAEARLQTVTVDILAGSRMIEIEQITGNMRIVATDFIAESNDVRVRTPSAVIEIVGGSDVVVRHNPANDQSEVVALSGSATVRHLFTDFPGEVTLEPLQTTVVSLDQAPSSAVFMDRGAFDALQAELGWRMPQPVPNWDARFAAHLEDLAEQGYGDVRRGVSRPLTPAWGVSEGMIDQSVPDRPGTVAPTPRSTLEVEFSIDQSGEDGP